MLSEHMGFKCLNFDFILFAINIREGTRTRGMLVCGAITALLIIGWKGLVGKSTLISMILTNVYNKNLNKRKSKTLRNGNRRSNENLESNDKVLEILVPITSLAGRRRAKRENDEPHLSPSQS